MTELSVSDLDGISFEKFFTKNVYSYISERMTWGE